MDNLREQLREKIFSKYRKDTWVIKTIGEIATDMFNGSEVTKEQLGKGNYSAIKCGDITSGKLNIFFEDCISFVDESVIKRPKYFEHGDLLVSNFSDSKKVGSASVYLGREKCLAGLGITVVKHKQNPKYLSFVWSSKFVRDQIVKSALQGTVHNFWSEKIKQIKIPLPPLEIQDQIVDFLDRFLELEIEWEKENEKRKLQYEYYRELLFSRGLREHNWPLKSLGEIALDIYSGIDVTKEQLGTGDHPAIKYIGKQTPMVIEDTEFVDLNLIKKPKYCEKGDILFCKFNQIKETVGRASVYLKDEKCLVGGAVVNLKHAQNPKFLTYFFSTSFHKEQMENLVKPGVIFQIYASTVKEIKVPVPSLEEQERIVETLDKLYGIVHDFKEGIPFLIRKNREQYEFYRELLLDLFKE